MQIISLTKRASYEDVLKTLEEKRTLINTLEKRRRQMIGQTLRHGNELHSWITEEMIVGSRSRGRPRTKYVSQVMKDAGVTSYEELKDTAYDSKKWRGHLL